MNLCLGTHLGQELLEQFLIFFVEEDSLFSSFLISITYSVKRKIKNKIAIVTRAELPNNPIKPTPLPFMPSRDDALARCVAQTTVSTLGTKERTAFLLIECNIFDNIILVAGKSDHARYLQRVLDFGSYSLLTDKL
jgi:hypothetical protein